MYGFVQCAKRSCVYTITTHLATPIHSSHMALPEQRRTEHFRSEHHRSEHHSRGRFPSRERDSMSPSPEAEPRRRSRHGRPAPRASDSSEGHTEPRPANPPLRAPPINVHQPSDYSHPNPFAPDFTTYAPPPGPPIYSNNAFAPGFQPHNPNVFSPAIQPMYRPGPPFGAAFEPPYHPNNFGPAYRPYAPPPPPPLPIQPPFDPFLGPPPHYADFPLPPRRLGPNGGNNFYPNPPPNNHHYQSDPFEAHTSVSMVGSHSTSSTSSMEREMRKLRKDVRHLKRENARQKDYDLMRREVFRQIQDFRRY
ncbi:hypothetical protein EDB81DRAFT_377477 [Dactylonectria macrodidyma]|uniref:Uncharacterized protein n=1 Tax=Dactylonectria macrodidyma TaxID=307937 RepID=A0A9P9F7F6_9HYPO|nr:hypothetical protein EDB81DRAFT_377477 [Dactylonectria macrodidyma]